jgi:shikimate 5-dehydrogenase
MRTVHAQIGLRFPVEYVLTSSPADTDAVIAGLPQGSLVVNATGLGKDAPGSPTTDAVRYPLGTTVWEFNYRGNLSFLAQASAQEEDRGLTVSDGWGYFIISWTRVIAEVFDIGIPTSGPVFEYLSQLARESAGR